MLSVGRHCDGKLEQSDTESLTRTTAGRHSIIPPCLCECMGGLSCVTFKYLASLSWETSISMSTCPEINNIAYGNGSEGREDEIRVESR